MAPFCNQMARVSSCIPVPLRNEMGAPHLHVTSKLHTHTKPSIQWISCLICAEPQHPNILWGFRKHNPWTWEFVERKYCAPWLCSNHTLSFSDGQHPLILRISYTSHLKFYKRNVATDDSSMKTRPLALERNKPEDMFCWGWVDEAIPEEQELICSPMAMGKWLIQVTQWVLKLRVELGSLNFQIKVLSTKSHSLTSILKIP